MNFYRFYRVYEGRSQPVFPVSPKRIRGILKCKTEQIMFTYVGYLKSKIS